MFCKKDLEARVVAAIAQERGGTAEGEHGAWPDGWIVDGSQRVPVEVVSAFPTMDAPTWARAHQQGAREALRIQRRSGVPVSWTVHDGRAVVLDGATEMPLDMRPTDIVPGILTAIDAKAAKYAPAVGASAILAVHHVAWPWPLQQPELNRIAAHIQRTGAPFREVWIANEFGDPAQRIR